MAATPSTRTAGRGSDLAEPVDPEKQPLQLRDYEDPGATAKPDQPLWLAALWFMGKLLFVLGLIYVALTGYKRFMGAQAQRPLGARVRVLESTRLAGTQSLYLVEAGEKILLLGSNGAGLMVKLDEWPAQAPPPELAETAFERSLSVAERRSDDFQGVVESSLQQVILPAEGQNG